jgi:dTMP kinase
MKKAQYICLEGTEGVGKTTQTKLLVDVLKARGYRVLQTKEPGIDLVPLTMKLRGIMLDNQYDAEMTRPAREFISQAIRSIHLENLIVPNLYNYDFIIQDRGILSGYAYGEACGNSFANLYLMATMNIDSADEGSDDLPLKPELIYDRVVYLRGDSIKGLAKAKSTKQEFETGDAMESRGNSFMEKVSKNMDEMSSRFKTVRIDVDGKSIEEVHSEILKSLELEK